MFSMEFDWTTGSLISIWLHSATTGRYFSTNWRDWRKRPWEMWSTAHRLEERNDKVRPKQEARIYPSAGFMLRVSRKRRYADLSYLLPMFPIGPAVKTRCMALPLGTPST